jgi:hypothetical protein
VPLREDSRDGKGERDTRRPEVEKVDLLRAKPTFLKQGVQTSARRPLGQSVVQKQPLRQRGDGGGTAP